MSSYFKNEEEESPEQPNPLLTRTKSFQESMNKPVSQHIEKLDVYIHIKKRIKFIFEEKY